jgi:hypothetical protein
MANQVKQTVKKRQFLFNPLKRPMPYIGLMLAVLIIIFQGTIRKYTANLVGDWLVSNLRESTEGNYTLNYDFVRFDIFTKELRIQNFTLELDSTVDREEYLDQYSNLVDISTPLVVLKLESLWDLILNDRLLIVYIGLQEPKVKLIRSESLTAEEDLENQQATAEKIRSYLEEIEIDSFRVLNGAIEVDLQNAQRQDLFDFKIRNFTTLLRGFKLDQIDPNKLFQGIYVEEVELEVLDQDINLPRMKHQISFERLWVSSVDSIIRFDTLEINPLANADSSLKSQIMLKEFTLEGIDFWKVYDENRLDIQSLKIEEPIIDLVNRKVKTDKTDSIISFNLPFKEVLIHKASLRNGNLKLDINRKISSDNINLTLNNYHIDTSTVSIDEITKNIKDFNINLSAGRIEMPDSIHELSFSLLHVNAKDSLASISNIRLNPISSRRSYQLYKERGVRLINYASVKQVDLSGIDFAQIIDNQQILVDSLVILSPSATITEYPYIKSSQKPGSDIQYLIKKTQIINGSIDFNKRQNRQNNRTKAGGISLLINNLYPDSGKPAAFDDLKLFVKSGSSELKSMAHTISFNNLESRNLTDFDIGQLSFLPDSSTIVGEKIDLKGTGIKIRGFDQNLLTQTGALKIDELAAESLSLNADLSTIRKNSNQPAKLKIAQLNSIFLKQGSFDIHDKDHNISIAKVSTRIDSLKYDITDTLRSIPVSFSDFILTHGNINISSKDNNFKVSGFFGRFSDADSLINFKDLSFSSGKNIKGKVDEIYLKGLDRKALLKNNALRFAYIYIDRPTIEIAGENSKQPKSKLNIDSLKSRLLNQFTFIDFDSIVNRNASISIVSDTRNTKIDNLNTLISNYRLDSSSTVKDVLQPKELKFSIANITTNSSSDTVSVQAVVLDMIKQKLITGRIAASIYQDKLMLNTSIPGVYANGFSIIKILSEDYSIDTIRLSQAEVKLVTHDTLIHDQHRGKTNDDLRITLNSMFKKSGKLMLDTLLKINKVDFGEIEFDSSKNINFKRLLARLKQGNNVSSDSAKVIHEDSLLKVVVRKKASPTHGKINFLGINNSSFIWLNNDIPHGFLSGLNFSIGLSQIILDTLNRFNIYDHVQDLSIKVKDYQTNLPDSLNSISFDELRLSTQDESIKIKNISFIPRVGKYEYANAKGFQASWQELDSLDLKIEGLDIYKVLFDKAIYVKKVSTSGGKLDIFKDKELPIPVNRRRPMLQDAIKSIKTPLLIDSISVDDLTISFTSRLSSKMPEGTISFHTLNASVTNVVNIDSLFDRNKNLHIKASTKILNKGLLAANFDFDMDSEDNNFVFDTHLSAMNAREFNSILEALAFVSVESGEIKDLRLKAEGDNYYATGNMTFIYNNLKVSTINKKNLKTTGMGKVVKSFFANAFVVKKNNPSFKVFPRDGAMYYERDPQKIIIDYVTKTALSGVVSSIGARNARKDIKKLQKESKKQKDAERRALKKAARNISSGL